MKQFSFVFLLVMLRLDNVFSGIVFKILPDILLSLLLVNNFITTRKSKYPFKLSIFIVIFLSVILIGIMRNSNPISEFIYEFHKAFTFLLLIIVFLQTVNVFLVKKSRGLFTLFYWTTYLPLLGLVLANIIGYLVDLNPINKSDVQLGKAVFLSNFGFNIERVNFPFSQGFNSYAIIVGILLLISLFEFKYIKSRRKTMLVGIFLSIITLLLIDTRSALLYPIMLFIFFFYIVKNIEKPKFLWLIPLISIFGSFLILFVLGLIAQIPELSFLERSSADFETGNARSFIWLQSSLEFLNFKQMHLIGYGEFGHFKSGASSAWSSIFSQWEDNADLISPHSVFYSILFDYGYIGLSIILALQYKMLAILKRNWKLHNGLCVMILAFIIYWNLIGVTETAFGFYTPNILPIFINFSIFIFLIEYLSLTRNISLSNSISK